MLVVFPNKKILSCDTVVPLLLAVRRHNPGKRIVVCCFDGPTYAAICRNVVLDDAIRLCGDFLYLGREQKGLWAKLWQRVRAVAYLAWFLLLGLVGAATFLHFRALNEWPLRLLYLCNRKRTVFLEADALGYRKLLYEDVANIARKRAVSTLALSSHVVAFSPDWPVLHAPENAHQAKYLLAPSRQTQLWFDYVRERAEAYLARDFAAAGLPPAPRIIVYILGYLGRFDFMREDGSGLRLFHETLEALVEEAAGQPIFVKPHVITDAAILADALARFPAARFIVTNLHPSVLATRASVFVCNYFSTTLADARAFGVPTIEYTDYSAATLKVTGGGSMQPQYVTHFANNDPAQLREALRQTVRDNAPTPVPSPAAPRDDAAVIELLAR